MYLFHLISFNLCAAAFTHSYFFYLLTVLFYRFYFNNFSPFLFPYILNFIRFYVLDFYFSCQTVNIVTMCMYVCMFFFAYTYIAFSSILSIYYVYLYIIALLLPDFYFKYIILAFLIIDLVTILISYYFFFKFP